MYAPCRGAIKLSIILFLVRALPRGYASRKALYGIAAWVVASEIAFTVPWFLQCRPLSKSWDPEAEGTCFDGTTLSYVEASINMVTAVVILLSPWFVIRGGCPCSSFRTATCGRYVNFLLRRAQPVQAEKA
jgi:hypothetical protein